MTDAERDLLLALASAVMVGTSTSIYDYAAADKLLDAKGNIHTARKEVEREMEARRPRSAPLLAELQSGSTTGPADGLPGEGRVLGGSQPAVQCPSCGGSSRFKSRRGWPFSR